MTRRDRARIGGLTLVELLVATAVTGVLLASIGAYFVFSTGFSERRQLLSDLETQARSVAELIAQDFQLVGSRAVTSRDASDDVAQAAYGTSSSELSSGVSCLDPTETASCVAWSGGKLDLVYMSSLWLPGPDLDDAANLKAACRKVTYQVVGGDLLRSDVPCLSTTVPDLGSVTEPFPYLAAPNISNLSLTFVCADDPLLEAPSPEDFSDPGRCYDSDPSAPRESFVREVQVSFTVTSQRDGTTQLDFETAAPTPNLRPPFSLVDGE